MTSADFDTFDRCERRFAFEREWESRAISPLALVYAGVEAAIVSDSPEQSAHDAILALAQTHELDSGENQPFMVIRHAGYLAAVVGTALQRRFGQFTPLSPVEGWQSSLYRADGRNHLISLVSHLDDDRLRGLAHSWRVVGELVRLKQPLTITTVVIGAHRGGRRHSAWSKGFLHPQNHQLRFQRRSKGSGFSDGWEEVWREHRGEISTEEWLAGMEGDGILTELIVNREVGYRPSDQRMIAAEREMEIIAKKMKTAPIDAPMRRSSCDETGRGACPFQSVCYSPVEVDPSQLVHLYRSR
jgi:hypothetical protein